MLVEAVTDTVQTVVALRYPLDRIPDEWEIPEVPVPESVAHYQLVSYLHALLSAWAQREGRNLLVASNLAVRWVEDRPRVGIDPDVLLVDPHPPIGRDDASLRLWEPQMGPPLLAIEVVSQSHPYKDYRDIPERYAAMGVQELWVLDPGRFGPSRLGGPHLIQRFVREDDATLVRRYAGEGPCHSSVVDAWVCSGAEPGITVCADAASERPWLTGEEAERRARVEAERQCVDAEQQRAEAEQQRAEAEQRRAEAEQRAKRLAQKLREAGINPDQ